MRIDDPRRPDRLAWNAFRTLAEWNSDVWVPAPTKGATITLITCFPFSYIGHAPQRFIVQAERVVPELTGTPLKGSVPTT